MKKIHKVHINITVMLASCGTNHHSNIEIVRAMMIDNPWSLWLGERPGTGK